MKLGILFSIINDLESEYILVMGHFNAHIGASPSRFGKFLIDSCVDNNCVISSKVLLPHDSFTYISERWGTTSWLDHCISSEGIHDLISNVRIDYNLSSGDHIPLGLELNINQSVKRSRIEFPPNSTTSIIWRKLKDDEIVAYSNRLDVFLNEIQVPYETLNCRNFECINPIHTNDQAKFFDAITSAIKKASQPLVKNSTGHRRREIPGWNEYVKEAHSNSANAAREWREAGLPRTGPLYENKVTRHKQYKYALRKTKRNEKSILNEKLAANLASNNGNQFWKDIRKVAGKTKTAPTSINGINGNIDICEMWKDHYEGILNCMQPRQYFVDKAKFDASAIVTAAEIHDCILSINITDSPGPDGLSTKHLKFGPASLCEKLAKWLTSFFVHGCIPHSIMDVHLVPVVKDYRGKLSDADNYRPIAIASCISKLIECCILNRIEEKISVTENQFGFKKGWVLTHAFLS